MPSPQDIALVSRLKTGDLSAFDELYLKYYTLLCTSAFFFLKNGAEAKDLVQSLFLDIWDKQLYLHFHDDIKGYLFLATKNRCLNYLKKEKVQGRHRKGYAALQEEGVRRWRGSRRTPPATYRCLQRDPANPHAFAAVSRHHGRAKR